MNLTEKQQNILNCLVEMQNRLSVEKVTNLRNISGNMPVSNKIDQAVKNLAIVFNGGDGYKWNPDVEINEQLLMEVEENINDPNHEKSLQLFEQFQNPSDPYPIPFEHVWRILGYANKHEAKRALYQDFNEGEDFINFSNTAEVSRENAGSRGPIEEMLRLSWRCFVHFTHSAQTKTARLISRKIIDRYFVWSDQKDKLINACQTTKKGETGAYKLIFKIEESHDILKKLRKKVENLFDEMMKVEEVKLELFNEADYDRTPLEAASLTALSSIAETLSISKFVTFNFKLLPNANQFQEIAQARESDQ